MRKRNLIKEELFVKKRNFLLSNSISKNSLKSWRFKIVSLYIEPRALVYASSSRKTKERFIAREELFVEFIIFLKY